MNNNKKLFISFFLSLSLMPLHAAHKKIRFSGPVSKAWFDGTIYKACADSNKEIYYQLALNGTILVATKKMVKKRIQKTEKLVPVYTYTIQKPWGNVGIRNRDILKIVKGKAAKEKFEEFHDFCE